MKLFGNKNYSSWSLRPWLLMRARNLPFAEEVIALYEPGSRDRLLQASPSGKVPVLVDGSCAIWDSLAIVEYLAERFPDHHLWPENSDARALARSVTCEMHSGFTALRTAMPMNCRSHLPGKGHTEAALADAARVMTIWADCRRRYGQGGPFLFGDFCIADAFYAPVVLRFRSYGVAQTDVAHAYSNAILGIPAIQEWMAAAEREPEFVAASEPYR